MQKRKIYLKFFVAAFLITFIFLGVIKLIDTIITDISNEAGINEIAYYEDVSKSLELKDAIALNKNNEFTLYNNSELNFGRSKSAFWIRIAIDDIGVEESYIAVHCPNIQDVKLYYITDQGECIKSSGWENSYNNAIKVKADDEGMTYPVFSIKDINKDEPVIYLRIESSYSHIYKIKIYNEEEYLSALKLDYFLNSACFGILFTIIIINICIYFAIKSKVSLYFDFCIIFLFANQGCITGFFNILLGKYAKSLMQFSIEFGFLYFISIIVFFIFLSEVRKNDKRYFRICIALIIGCLMGILYCFYDKVTANLLAHILCIAVAVFVMYASFQLSIRNKLKNVFFLVGWNFTVIVYTAFILNVEGILHLKSDIWGFHSAIFMVIIVSAIFTIASIKYTRTIQTEYLLMQQQVHITTEKIKRTENVLLQTQIKPHFLYNTLTAIEQLCEIDAGMAQKEINNFAEYLRNNIDFSFEAGVIPIEKEIENVKCYLALEKMRFDERLKVVYDIERSQFNIPPLVIQPMVENAVRHGITKKREGGTVIIKIREKELFYIISIIDDGIGFNTDQIYMDDTSSHIGIDNARERVERLSCGSFSISSQIGKGTKVIIKIPKDQNMLMG